MYLNTKGLVLRTTAYNDMDALLSLLTPNHGKITVKAKISIEYPLSIVGTVRPYKF